REGQTGSEAPYSRKLARDPEWLKAQVLKEHTVARLDPQGESPHSRGTSSPAEEPKTRTSTEDGGSMHPPSA
ncbi:MAG: hypothetical protein SGPRY_010637, partial [Prymnesium sp.]